MGKKAADLLFARNRVAPIQKRVEEMVGSFLKDFVTGKSMDYLEPNFQRHFIRVRRGTKQNLSFKLEEEP